MIFEKLLERQSNAGTVVSVSDDFVTVATARGTVRAVRIGATAYQVGDRVRLADEQVLGRLRSTNTIVRV